MGDNGPVVVAALMIGLILLALWGVHGAGEFVHRLFEPPATLLHRATPCTVNVPYYVGIDSDGPLQIENRAANGAENITYFTPGTGFQLISGDGMRPGVAMRFTSRDPKRTVHFTLRELRLRHHFFRNAYE
jgi:hypothetical protein